MILQFKIYFKIINIMIILFNNQYKGIEIKFWNNF